MPVSTTAFAPKAMRRAGPIVLLLLFGAPAHAQEMGLDLTPAEKDKSSEDMKPGEQQPEPQAKGPLGTDVTSGDRVKAVQHKHFLEAGRLDLEPVFGVSLNDAFRPKLGTGAVLSYHLADSLALGLRYDRYAVLESDNQRIAKRELQAVLPSSNLEWDAGAEFQWTPINGKLTFGNGIVAYDLFLTAGLGAAFSQTSGAPVNDGLHPAAAIGLSNRFSLADFMALQLGVRQLLYDDRPGNRELSRLQKVLTLDVGISFWIPFSAEAAQ